MLEENRVVIQVNGEVLDAEEYIVITKLNDKLITMISACEGTVLQAIMELGSNDVSPRIQEVLFSKQGRETIKALLNRKKVNIGDIIVEQITPID